MPSLSFAEFFSYKSHIKANKEFIHPPLTNIDAILIIERKHFQM